MKKKFIATLLSMSLVFSLVGCSSKADTTTKTNEIKQEQKTEAKKPTIQDGGTFIFSSDSDPLTLNPLYMGDRSSHMVNNAIFDSLFTEHDGKITYHLAKELKISDDMKTYTVILKDNLKWHDGNKITADDIVFTCNTILNSKGTTGARENFVINDKEVKVSKKDDLTVEFKLPEVYVPFKAALTDFRPIPKHVFEKEKDIAKAEASTSKPIGSGPFKFKEWKKGEMLTLERFDDYYAGKPHMDKVVFRIITDDNSSGLAFQNGEVSATYVSDESYLKYSKDDKFKDYSYPEGMTYYMALNVKNPILSKKEVRQAIAYALNKEEIIKSYSTEELTKKAYSVFPPSTFSYTEDIEKYNHDLDKAKELMKKSGVTKGKLKFLYPSGGGLAKKIALVVQQQLKEIGLDIDLVSLDSKVFYEKIMGKKARDFDLTLNGYVFGDEPSTYSNAFYTNSTFNASQYSNKELDKLFDEGKVEKDSNKRKEIYENIQKTIADDLPIYTIDYPTSKVVTQNNLGGVEEARLVPIYMFEDLSKLYFTK
ncbi:ABC transporter substrate-binding protein [Hathewaya limosa]|uniref:Peptide/nickel transport system substrate-binding protein n=1 Tax=Hathewaya limosa TaxID=1536 RepID=A0ABU0JRD1_HATLI|nr:ABC transporter substrate-binding protein [Hathewaya limosa]MDQ0478811.1 peptide/nickel transport system substrate-binding protein [Hathewaya limosa]